MDFGMTKPCSNCPFLKKGGIRLHPARVREIGGMMLSSQGGTFACHKTTTVDDFDNMDDETGQTFHVAQKGERHCAGALIFAEKNKNATQIMRIMERIRAYDARRLMADKAVVATVFDSLPEMLKVNRKEN